MPSRSPSREPARRARPRNLSESGKGYGIVHVCLGILVLGGMFVLAGCGGDEDAPRTPERAEIAPSDRKTPAPTPQEAAAIATPLATASSPEPFASPAPFPHSEPATATLAAATPRQGSIVPSPAPAPETGHPDPASSLFPENAQASSDAAPTPAVLDESSLAQSPAPEETDDDEGRRPTRTQRQTDGMDIPEDAAGTPRVTPTAVSTLKPTPDAGPTFTRIPTSPPSPTPDAGEGVMFFDPPGLGAVVGESFTLHLRASISGQPIGGYAVAILYNPLKIHLDGVREGDDPLLGRPLINIPEATSGILRLSAIQATSQTQPIGPAISFARLDFRAREAGQVRVEIAGTEFSTADGFFDMKIAGEIPAIITITEPQQDSP